MALTEREVAERLEGTEWEMTGGGDEPLALWREVEVRDFRAALALVNAIGEVAEERGHHPDLLVHGYRRVRVTLSTHSAGGVTDADFDLLLRVDPLLP